MQKSKIPILPKLEVVNLLYAEIKEIPMLPNVTYLGDVIRKSRDTDVTN
jgi:hypothetical protein